MISVVSMTASTETGLQQIIDSTNRVVNQYRMRINIKKTKVMKVGREQGRVYVEVEGKVLNRSNTSSQT